MSDNLTKHIISMSLTSAVGFSALFIVDLVDMLFISMLGIDELAAAVGFAGSILFMTTSISIGMAIAGGAMVARSLGENEPKRASELLTHVLIVGVAFAVVFASLLYTLKRPEPCSLIHLQKSEIVCCGYCRTRRLLSGGDSSVLRNGLMSRPPRRM